MSDLKCPYCEAEHEIRHRDDGSEYEEDIVYEMECYKCKKKFVFHTIVKVYYFPSKADCLNGSPHMFGEWLKLWNSNGELIEQRICRDCEHYERRIIKENQIEKNEPS